MRRMGILAVALGLVGGAVDPVAAQSTGPLIPVDGVPLSSYDRTPVVPAPFDRVSGALRPDGTVSLTPGWPGDPGGDARLSSANHVIAGAGLGGVLGAVVGVVVAERHTCPGMSVCIVPSPGQLGLTFGLAGAVAGALTGWFVYVARR